MEVVAATMSIGSKPLLTRDNHGGGSCQPQGAGAVAAKATVEADGQPPRAWPLHLACQC